MKPWQQYIGPIVDQNIPSITCPRCKRTSYNTNDIEQQWCGHCQRYHFEVDAVEPQASTSKPKLPRCWLGMWMTNIGKIRLATEEDVNLACTCVVPIQAFMCAEGGLHECHKQAPAEDES